jgi:hypothetical protein
MNSEKFYNLCCSPNIIEQIKCDEINSHGDKILTVNRKERDQECVGGQY